MELSLTCAVITSGRAILRSLMGKLKSDAKLEAPVTSAVRRSSSGMHQGLNTTLTQSSSFLLKLSYPYGIDRAEGGA